mgnify:CR=1 FL=1
MAAQSRNIAELENASVWRLLIQYSLPSIAGMVVYSLYNIIDSVFIGHGVGPLALSGLAVTFPIMNLTFALGTLVGIGGAAISSIRLLVVRTYPADNSFSWRVPFLSINWSTAPYPPGPSGFPRAAPSV